jgi:hypothetical protein
MFDIDPDKAAQTRHKFYDMASAEQALVVGFTSRSRRCWVT